MAKVHINIRFQKILYDSDKEMSEHKPKMLEQGWKVDWITGLCVCYKKSE